MLITIGKQSGPFTTEAAYCKATLECEGISTWVDTCLILDSNSSESNIWAHVDNPGISYWLACILPGPAHLSLDHAGTEELAAQENAGETAEQYMMRRIKNWNVAVRERPHELQLWLDFAAFQDEISKYAQCLTCSSLKLRSLLTSARAIRSIWDDSCMSQCHLPQYLDRPQAFVVAHATSSVGLLQD